MGGRGWWGRWGFGEWGSGHVLPETGGALGGKAGDFDGELITIVSWCVVVGDDILRVSGSENGGEERGTGIHRGVNAGFGGWRYRVTMLEWSSTKVKG